jgi:acetamidase/formamidase
LEFCSVKRAQYPADCLLTRYVLALHLSCVCVQVPANLHIGNIGLSPAWDEAVNSIPPLPTGGNMDNKRVGAGSTLYLPVQVAGALLSMGDAHTAQGDSELDGTGVETSINGKFKLTLHKAGALPKFVAVSWEEEARGQECVDGGSLLSAHASVCVPSMSEATTTCLC